MRPEHLVAIMLATGRPKDYLRISMFLEEGAVDMRSLKAVLRMALTILQASQRFRL